MKRPRYRWDTRRKPRTGRKPLLTPALKNRLKAEAHSLGMNAQDYMDVVLGLSASLRKALNLGEKANVSQYLRLVKHPMFSLLMQWVVQTATSAASDSEEEKTDAQMETPTGTGPVPPQSGPPSPQQPYVGQPYPGQPIRPPAQPRQPAPWQYW